MKRIMVRQELTAVALGLRVRRYAAQFYLGPRGAPHPRRCYPRCGCQLLLAINSSPLALQCQQAIVDLLQDVGMRAE